MSTFDHERIQSRVAALGREIAKYVALAKWNHTAICPTMPVRKKRQCERWNRIGDDDDDHTNRSDKRVLFSTFEMDVPADGTIIEGANARARPRVEPDPRGPGRKGARRRT